MVPGLSVSHINESQLQTYKSRTIFLMTSLQYYCFLGLAEIKTCIPETKICANDAGYTGNKITAQTYSDALKNSFPPPPPPPPCEPESNPRPQAPEASMCANQ